MSNCSLLNWARNSIEVATGKMQLGVAPPESWGLVWCRQPEERERTRDSANLGKIDVLEQDLDLELVKRWCLHKNEQGEALVK